MVPSSSSQKKSINASHLREVVRSFDSALVDCCLNYVMKALGHLGHKGAAEVWSARDSIIYRGWAINWHFELLCNQRDSLDRELRGRIQEALTSPEPLIHARAKQFFVFDDLIFNAISLFDYIGNLIGFIYLGGSRLRLKWNGAFNAASDASNPISQAAVAELIRRNHKEWLNSLQAVRSDLTHFRMNLGRATQSINFKASEIEAAFHITLPPSLVTQLPFLRFEGSDIEVDLVEGAAMLIRKALENGQEILSCLRHNEDWPRRFG